jgi:DNA-binding transcriptional MerR regulator
MTMSTLSSNEAAEAVGVSPSTVKNWAVRLPVPSWVDRDGTRRFPPEAIDVLAVVKRMREDERSYATIRRVIEPAIPFDSAALVLALPETPAPEAPARLGTVRATGPLDPAALEVPPGPTGRLASADVMTVVRPLWNALQSEQAAAARRIARLEDAVARLQDEAEALRGEVVLLRQRANRPPRRSWLRRLFGR